MVSHKLQSDYCKLIEICDNVDTASKILSPFVFKKTLDKEKYRVVVQEILKTPIAKLTQESEFTKKNNDTIQIRVLKGALSKTVITFQFIKSEQGSLVSVDLSLETNLNLRLLKKKIQQRLLNIIEGLLINFDNLTVMTDKRGWTKSLINDDGLIISKNFPPLTIYGWFYSAISEIFYSEVYSSLPVKDKTVVDVGANIGDSSIYFAMNGAKKVIAIEPFLKNFNFAKKNIIENHLNDKIILENCMLSDNNSMIKIDSEYAGTGVGEISNSKPNIHEDKNWINISTHTLDYLIKKYNIEDASLKIDCEGCEYDVILSSTKETLQKFRHIIIEYHDGYERLKNKLSQSGFKVKIDSDTNHKMGFMTALNDNQT